MPITHKIRQGSVSLALGAAESPGPDVRVECDLMDTDAPRVGAAEPLLATVSKIRMNERVIYKI
jgi:hypothetical protein